MHSVLGSILPPHVPIPDTSDPPTVAALPAERELHFLPFLDALASLDFTLVSE